MLWLTGSVRYERHSPEITLLYQLVERHSPEFKAILSGQGKLLMGYVGVTARLHWHAAIAATGHSIHADFDPCSAYTKP